MENELLKVATSQSMWALLSMSLLLCILKAQEEREITSKLTEKFTIVETIKKDVEDIKESVLKRTLLCPHL